MLTEIELTDFQCHKSLKLPLSRITTLVGSSDSGKSACIRALEWCIFNRGTGTAFMRRGSRTVSVTVKVNDKNGNERTISRTSQKNAYIVDDIVHGAINREVPADVTAIFSMSDDNVQRQHDNLYWFTASGGVLTSNLNKIVDLSTLEEWVKKGVAFDRRFNDQITQLLARQEKISTDRQELLPYRALDTHLSQLEKLQGDIESAIDRKQAITTTLEKITACNVSTITLKIAALEDILVGYEKLQKTYTKINELRRILDQLRSTRVTDIADLVQIWEPLQKQFTNIVQKRKQYEELRVYQFRPIPLATKSIQDIFDELSNLKKRQVSLSSILQKHTDNQESLHSCIESYDTLEQEFQAVAGICPLCGTKN